MEHQIEERARASAAYGQGQQFSRNDLPGKAPGGTVTSLLILQAEAVDRALKASAAIEEQLTSLGVVVPHSPDGEARPSLTGDCVLACSVAELVMKTDAIAVLLNSLRRRIAL